MTVNKWEAFWLGEGKALRSPRLGRKMAIEQTSFSFQSLSAQFLFFVIL